MSNYWEKRIANDTWKTYNNLEEKNRALLEMYQDASRAISDELYTLTEKLQTSTPSLSDMHKYNRLTGLRNKMESIIRDLGENVETFGKENMFEGFKDTYSNVMVQLGKLEFDEVPKKVMEEMLNRPWQGGTFSERLWKNTQVLASNLNEILVNGLTQGKTVTEMAIQLSNMMNTGFNISHRLIRTETMHYLNESAFKGYEDAGCEEVELWAAEDERTCEICGAKHGTKYKIKDRPTLPLHANCRCTYLPVVDLDKKKEDNFIKDNKVKANYSLNKNLSNMDKALLKDLSKASKKMLKEFPQVNDLLQEIRFNNRLKNSYAQAKMNLTNGKINCSVDIGSIFSDKTTILNQILSDLNGDFHYKGTTPESIVVHEFTHILNYKMAIDKCGVDINNCTVKEWNVVVNEITNIATDIRSKAFSNLGVNINSKEAYLLQEPLGKYSFTNTKEFLAEALSEALCVKKPSKISLEVLKILKGMV